MNDRRLHRADPTHQGCADAQHVHHADADEQVFLNRALGAAGNGTGRSDLAEVVGHQRNVSGFACRLRAAATHRVAGIGLCQRGALLMPSPTIAARWHWPCSLAMAETLSSGIRSARTSSIPSSAAIAWAVAAFVTGQQHDPLDVAGLQHR